MLSNLAVSFDGEAFILAWEVSEDPEAPVTEYVVHMTYADEEELMKSEPGESETIATVEFKPAMVLDDTEYRFFINASSAAGVSETLTGNYTGQYAMTIQFKHLVSDWMHIRFAIILTHTTSIYQQIPHSVPCYFVVTDLHAIASRANCVKLPHAYFHPLHLC